LLLQKLFALLLGQQFLHAFIYHEFVVAVINVGLFDGVLHLGLVPLFLVHSHLTAVVLQQVAIHKVTILLLLLVKHAQSLALAVHNRRPLIYVAFLVKRVCPYVLS
jgi:hypothetical protein